MTAVVSFHLTHCRAVHIWTPFLPWTLGCYCFLGRTGASLSMALMPPRYPGRGDHCILTAAYSFPSSSLWANACRKELQGGTVCSGSQFEGSPSISVEGEPWWQAAFSFVFSNLVHGMETHSPWTLLSQLNLAGGVVIDT